MPTARVFHVAIESRQGQLLGVIPIDIRGGEHSVLRKPQNRTFAGAGRTLATVGASAIDQVGTFSQGFAGRAK